MKGSLTSRRWAMTMTAYALPFLLCAVLLPHVGPSTQRLAGPYATGSAEAEEFIFHSLRLPRVILALVAGGSLAIVGACFQVILRNPLAEPYTLGVTGGAAVGAVLVISVRRLQFGWGPFSTVQLFALAGAGISVLLIYRLARRPQGISMSVLLLAGVTISILCGGLVLFIRYIADPHSLLSMDRWLMGGISPIGLGELLPIVPFVVVGLGILLPQMPALNHLALGEGIAMGHGVDVPRVQRMVFIGGSLLTAGVVSLTGPIGFVGLIVPHAVRRVSGFDHRVVVPASFLAGGAFLALCDTVGRTVLPLLVERISEAQQTPVGVLTALIGAPIFIRILIGRRR